MPLPSRDTDAGGSFLTALFSVICIQGAPPSATDISAYKDPSVTKDLMRVHAVKLPATYSFEAW